METLTKVEIHCSLSAVSSVDDLHVLQETIMGILTQQAFKSWAALSFNALRLIDNKLACDRVVTYVSGNCSVCKTK